MERGIEILLLLAAGSESLEVPAIASRLRLPASSVYRILRTLRKRGLVMKDGDGQGYRLGLTVLEMAASVQRGLDIARLAAPMTRRLSEQLGETALLNVLDGDRAITAQVSVTSDPVRVAAELGRNVPLWAGAAQKAIFAYLPEPRCREIVKGKRLVPFTRNTITDVQRLWRDRETIRRQGYAVSDGEVINGARAVAAPVFNERGEVVAALAIFGPAHRFYGTRLQRAIPLLRREARLLSRALGFRRRPGRGADDGEARLRQVRTPEVAS